MPPYQRPSFHAPKYRVGIDGKIDFLKRYRPPSNVLTRNANEIARKVLGKDDGSKLGLGVFFFPFLELPTELRIMVYLLILLIPVPVRLIGPVTRSSAAFLNVLTGIPTLLSLCKAVYNEARPIFLARNSISPDLGVAKVMRFHGLRDNFRLRYVQPRHYLSIASFRTITIGLHRKFYKTSHQISQLSQIFDSIVEIQQGNESKVELELWICRCASNQRYEAADSRSCRDSWMLQNLYEIIDGFKKIRCSSSTLVVPPGRYELIEAYAKLWEKGKLQFTITGTGYENKHSCADRHY